MFEKRDKHHPSRSGQTILDTAVTNFTKLVTKINFGPININCYNGEVTKKENGALDLITSKKFLCRLSGKV